MPPYLERRFYKLTDTDSEGDWGITDGEWFYPFGPRDSAERVLRNHLSESLRRDDRLESYGRVTLSMYPVSEIEWCKDKVLKRYPNAWGFTNFQDQYCISRGHSIWDNNRNWEILARAETEIEAWRAAEEVVAIEEGRRQSANITIPKPPDSPWVTITDFNPNPEPAREPEVSHIEVYRTPGYGYSGSLTVSDLRYGGERITVRNGILTGVEPSHYYQYDQEATNDLLRGQVPESSDGGGRTFLSRCTVCCFTEPTDGNKHLCPQCGGRTVHYTPCDGSYATQQTVWARHEQSSL